MSWRTRGAVLIVGAAVAGAGCASTAGGARGDRVAAGLVMPAGAPGESLAVAGAWPAGPDTWEFGRNDESLNAGHAPVLASGVAVIFNRDQTRTTNGRAREHSATFVRTISVRQTP